MFYQLSGHPISPVKLTHKITHQNSHQVSLAELLLTFLSSPLQSKSSLQVLLYNLMVVQFSSVTQSCPTLCDPMNRSTPGLPVHHQLLDFTQTQRPSSRWCHPAISSPVIPFSSCPQSLPALESSNELTLHMRWPKYWSFSFSIIPSKEIPGLISFRMDWWWYPCIKAFRQQSWAVKESPKLWWSLVLVTEQITFHGLLLSGSSKETKEPVYSVCVCVWLDQEI